MTRVLSRLLALYALRCAWRAWRRKRGLRQPSALTRALLRCATDPGIDWNADTIKVKLVDEPITVRLPPVTFRAWDGYVFDGLRNEDGTPHVFPLDGSLVANGNDVMITWTNTEPRIFQI